MNRYSMGENIEPSSLSSSNSSDRQVMDSIDELNGSGSKPVQGIPSPKKDRGFKVGFPIATSWTRASLPKVRSPKVASSKSNESMRKSASSLNESVNSAPNEQEQSPKSIAQANGSSGSSIKSDAQDKKSPSSSKAFMEEKMRSFASFHNRGSLHNRSSQPLSSSKADASRVPDAAATATYATLQEKLNSYAASFPDLDHTDRDEESTVTTYQGNKDAALKPDNDCSLVTQSASAEPGEDTPSGAGGQLVENQATSSEDTPARQAVQSVTNQATSLVHTSGSRVQPVKKQASLSDDTASGSRVQPVKNQATSLDDTPSGSRVQQVKSQTTSMVDTPSGSKVQQVKSQTTSLAEEKMQLLGTFRGGSSHGPKPLTSFNADTNNKKITIGDARSNKTGTGGAVAKLSVTGSTLKSSPFVDEKGCIIGTYHRSNSSEVPQSPTKSSRNTGNEIRNAQFMNGKNDCIEQDNRNARLNGNSRNYDDDEYFGDQQRRQQPLTTNGVGKERDVYINDLRRMGPTPPLRSRSDWCNDMSPLLLSSSPRYRGYREEEDYYNGGNGSPSDGRFYPDQRSQPRRMMQQDDFERSYDRGGYGGVGDRFRNSPRFDDDRCYSDNSKNNSKSFTGRGSMDKNNNGGSSSLSSSVDQASPRSVMPPITMQAPSSGIVPAVSKIGPNEIEVSPGVVLPLQGTQVTLQAIMTGSMTNAACLACARTLYCIESADYVICPECRIVSPVERTESNSTGGSGVGLGMMESEFFSLVATI